MLLRYFVPARFTAGRAIKKPILAEAYTQLTLAEAAKFVADALAFRHIALHADILLSGSCA